MEKEMFPVSRPVQIDSFDLDQSLIDLLGSKIEALQIDSLSEYSAEISLLLKVQLWFHKILKQSTSIGMESYSLVFANSARQDLNLWQRLSFLIEPLGIYFRDRFSDRLSYESQKKLDKSLAVIKSLEVINYFIFLYNGRYRTLLERLFSIQLYGPKRSYSSNWTKTQSILNRDLNWRLLSQILTLSLPLLLTSRWFNRWLLAPLLARTLNRTKKSTMAASHQNHRCAICSKSPTNTSTIPKCEHHYCYVCVAHEILQYGCYECDKCGTSSSISSLDELSYENNK